MVLGNNAARVQFAETETSVLCLSLQFFMRTINRMLQSGEVSSLSEFKKNSFAFTHFSKIKGEQESRFLISIPKKVAKTH